MSGHRDSSPISIDISVVIHRVRVVTMPEVLDDPRMDRHADSRGSDTARERLIDGVPSALSAYRLEVP
jgi:hypothetical protein